MATAVPQAVAHPRYVTGLRWLTGILLGAYLVTAPLDTVAYQPWRKFGLYTVVVVLAFLLVAVRATTVALDRAAWATLALAVGVWVSADCLYVVAERSDVLAMEIVDWLYVFAYPALFAGIALLLYNKVGRKSVAVWLDAATVALGLSAFVILAVPNVFVTNIETFNHQALSVIEPVMDILLLCVLLGTLSMLGWVADRTWWCLLFGGFLLWESDMGFLLIEAIGVTYVPGSIVDIGWISGLTLIGFAAWQPARSTWKRPSFLCRVGVPAAALAASFILLVVATQLDVPTLSVAFAAAAVVAAGGRVMWAARHESMRVERERHVYTDDLTGLSNRRAIKKLIAELSEQRQPFTLGLCNISRFKDVNDAYGHEVGDELLISGSKRLRRALPEDSCVARLGADEFAFLIPEDIPAPQAHEFMMQVAHAWQAPFTLAAGAITVTAYVGYIQNQVGDNDPAAASTAADLALHRAKRTQVPAVCFDAALDQVDADRVVLAQQLRQAIADGTITCAFQPKLTLATNTVHSVEVLARWNQPGRGAVPPVVFVALAQRDGMMMSLTQLMVNSTLRQIAAWVTRGIHLQVAVNVSLSCLLDERMLDIIREGFARYPVDPQLLTLEVTETFFTDSDDDVAMLTNCVGQLAQLGVRLSVDDYGTGHSSLSQWGALGAVEVKLDKSFVTGVGVDNVKAAVVRSTVELAEKVGVTLVAEGVETESDLLQVTALGAHVAQGYFIARPLPAAELETWLSNRNKRSIASQPTRRV